MADTRETVWIKIKDYARTRQLSESTVRRMIKTGQLTVERYSPRCVRIRLTRVVRSSQERSQAP
jgi:hypothetical protein